MSEITNDGARREGIVVIQTFTYYQLDVPTDAILLDLSRRVEAQLGRYGVADGIAVKGHTLELTGRGAKVRVTVGSELEVFRTAEESQRCLVVERLARELSSRRRASSSRSEHRTNWFEWGRLLFSVVATAGGLYGAWYWLGRPAHEGAFGGAPKAMTPRTVSSENSAQSTGLSVAPSQVLDAEKSRDARCNAVRVRVSTGGSVGPLDVDGWVVELALLSPLNDLYPGNRSLERFFRQDPTSKAFRVTSEEAPALRDVGGPDTWVQLTAEPLAGVLPQTQSGIRIVFVGRYVSFYFDSSSRITLTRFASSVYEASGANYGALYARCANGRTHHLGSWFRGADWGKTSLILVSTMGLYADTPHLFGVEPNGDALTQRRVFSQFYDGSTKLTHDKFKLLLADDGGMVAARPGKWATFTFPFSDGNRATRTSLRMVKTLGLGPSL